VKPIVRLSLALFYASNVACSSSGESTGSGGAASLGGTGGVSHTGGATSGGSVGTDTGGQATGGSAGSADIVIDGPCTLETVRVEVSGGMNFTRTKDGADSCRGVRSGENSVVGIVIAVEPPEISDFLLLSTLVAGVPEANAGSFPTTHVVVGRADGSSSWSTMLPDSQNPMECAVTLTLYTQVMASVWRLAGSVSCPSPLTGTGMAGGTPLTIIDWSFSVLLESAGAEL
jgi:hypothetical protein